MEMPLLTAKEVADKLGVSVCTVYRLANQRGGLRGYKVGRLVRFKAPEVEAYIAAQEIRPPASGEPFPEARRFAYRPGMRVVSL